jgi:Protein of unknown function (DUF5818)
LKERLGNPFKYLVEGGKKMRKHILILTLVAFALVAVVGVARPAAARGPEGMHWWSEQPATMQTITGVVERTDNGLSLVTSGGHEYILTGRDLSREAGDKVAVTGELSKNVGERPEIAVKSFTPCKYC